ncbi:hypothetical protein DYI26_18825 [Halomonas litopenaei]|nr:hypothetical protein [Halomonas litopenaei]
MIAFARLILVVMVLMTICYIIVNIYLFFRWRKGLEDEWKRRTSAGDERVFVRRSMSRYRRRWRPILISLIYIFPITLMTVLVFVINFF